MLAWIASKAAGLFGAKIIGGFVDAYKAKLDAGNTSEHIAADLAARELTVQQAEIEAQTQLRIAQVGKWYEPEKLFAYVLLVYFAKVYLYDAAFGLGTTDAVRGETASWAGIIMTFYFGKRGVENVTSIIARVLRK